VVVAAGDSFWSLAVDAVADDPGRGDVGDYWRRLIAANRARLVDPANPDLLYAGQVLALPAAGG
jgi:nucleoid-associated protein YgaU